MSGVTLYSLPTVQSVLDSSSQLYSVTGAGLYTDTRLPVSVLFNNPTFTTSGVWSLTNSSINISVFGETSGTQFVTAQNTTLADTSTHAGKSHTASSIISQPTGTGTNGPTNADYAQIISLNKKNFGSGTAATGELDGMYIVVRNDSAAGNPNSDTTGFLMDIANYGSGFNAGYEIHTATIASNVINSQIALQAAVINNRDGGSWGYVYNATIGAQSGAQLMQNQGTGRWGFLQQFVDSTGVIRFNIPVDSNQVARIQLKDSAGNQKTMRVNSNKLSFLNSGESAEIMTVDDSGNLVTGGTATLGNTTVNGSLSTTGNDALFYQNTTAQSFTSGVAAIVTGWTSVFDRVNTYFNASTGVFTAPATGIYQISAGLLFSANTGAITTLGQVNVVANSVVVASGLFIRQTASSTAMNCTVNCLVSLSVGQTLSIQGIQNTGGAVTLNGQSTGNYISINRVP